MPTPNRPMKIDVHHHFLPPVYVEALSANGGDPSGFPTPSWSLEGTLSIMAATQTSHTVLSLTAPGVQTVPVSEQPALARSVNEYAAALCTRHPEKFSFFAAVPTPLDAQACLDEIAYALDTLHAAGVILFTSYAPPAVSASASASPSPAYLGHLAFRPIWAELNRRSAVVFIHPTHAAGMAMIDPLLPGPFIDYPHETARTAMSLLVTGTKHAFPACKIILSHAGGTLPILLFRAVPGVEMISRARAAAGVPGAAEPMAASELVADAMTFYFDLALSGSRNVLDTLVRNFPTDRILFGSDFPYAPRQAIEGLTGSLEAYELEEEVRSGIYRGNAEALWPGLKGLEKGGV